VASPQTVKRRLIERASARDQIKLNDWDAYWQTFGSLKCSWQGAERVQVANDTDNDFSEIDTLLGALHT